MAKKLKTVGKGEQPAEVLLVQKRDGVLRIDDCGGWSQRHESMARLISDAAEELPDFAPVLVQTTDRCLVQRTEGGELRLHLWQNQPLPAWLLADLPPLTRVLSMCGTPRYADVPIADWAFDLWPEAGVEQGGYDAACAALAAVGAMPPRDARVATYGALIDIQGKGYSSRLKLLLHSGRPVLLCARPWVEWFHAHLTPWQHYVPVRADLADLVERATWVATHPAEAAAIGAKARAMAQGGLTHEAACAQIRQTLREMSS